MSACLHTHVQNDIKPCCSASHRSLEQSSMHTHKDYVPRMSMTALCRSNHGLLTMYEFGETIGGLDRCYYFGYGKDLYHFDHFMGNLFADIKVVYHSRALS